MSLTDFSPQQHDLVLYRGDTIRLPLRLGYKDTAVPPVFHGYDLTGVIFNAQIRSKEDSATIMAEFIVELDDQTVEETRGKMLVSLSRENAELLIASASKAKWDLQALWPGDVVRTYLRGDVTIRKDTTRE